SVSAASSPARVTAVGRPAATSSAKLGPDRTKGMAAGAHSARISLWRRSVPRSRPLAERITGRPPIRAGGSAESAARLAWAGTARIKKSASGSCVTAVTSANSNCSPRKRGLRCSALIAATTSGSRATSVTCRPAAAAAWAKAVPQAPPPTIATCSSRIDRHVRCIERPSRPGGESEPADGAQRQPLGAGPGDHRAIIGAERRRRDDQLGGGRRRHLAEGIADPPVRRDAAGNDEARLGLRQLGAKAGERRGGAMRDDLGYRRLEARADVGDVLSRKRGDFLGREAHRRLQARELKVEPGFAQQRPREAKASGIAGPGLAL